MTWHSSLESLAEFTARDHFAVTATDSPEFVTRVNEWIAWYLAHGQFPPGLVTADGMLVDGHHRIRAARALEMPLPCCVVEPLADGWRATGAVAICW